MANTAANRKYFAEHPPIAKGALVLESAQEVFPAPPPKKKKYTPDQTRYKGWRGQQRRPRCANRGCDRSLRLHQSVVCSDACSDALFLRAMDWLLRLGVTKKEILDYLEDAKGKVG